MMIPKSEAKKAPDAIYADSMRAIIQDGLSATNFADASSSVVVDKPAQPAAAQEDCYYARLVAAQRRSNLIQDYLFYAALTDDLSDIRHFYAGSVPSRCFNSNGNNPLHTAIIKNSMKVATFFIRE